MDIHFPGLEKEYCAAQDLLDQTDDEESVTQAGEIDLKCYL